MAITWFRSWHGAPTDTKWLGIARSSKQPISLVITTAWALMDYASQEDDRGTVKGFNADDFSAFVGVECEEVEAVLIAMKARGFIDGDRLSNWDEYQPEREDSSAERMRKLRERRRKVTQSDASVTQGDAPERDTDKDTDKEGEREEAEAQNPPPILEKLGPEKNLSISPEKLKALKSRFGKEVERYVIKLSLYKKAEGKVYADDGAVMESWLWKDFPAMQERAPPVETWFKCKCKHEQTDPGRCQVCNGNQMTVFTKKKELQSVYS